MSKKYNSDETIAHIIQVATALFIEKGYEKTTIQDIVANLDGLSRGVILILRTPLSQLLIKEFPQRHKYLKSSNPMKI